MNGPDDKTAPAQRRMRWVQVSGFAIGVCLLAGAGTVVFKDRDAFSFAVGSLRAAPGWLFALLLVLPCDVVFGRMEALGLLGFAWDPV